MLTRKSLLLTVTMVASGTLFAVTELRANPTGVPVAEPGPLSCTTTNFTITAVKGPNDEFPQVVPCNLSVNAGKQCAKYAYDISSSSKSVDHTVVAVSADQDLDSTNPVSPPTGVNPPGAGDSPTGFLVSAFHEYTVTFNKANSKSNHVEIVVVGPSSPRIATVLVRGSSGSKRDDDYSGKSEACLIAGPGVVGDPFQPVAVTQTATVAGGKCIAHLIFDASGKLADVTTEPPCITYSGPVTVTPDGKPLQNNTSPNGITFGNGTTTCYGPPVPSPARCVCTKAPCP